MKSVPVLRGPQIFLFVILFVYKVNKGTSMGTGYFLFVFLFVYTKGAVWVS